MADVIAVVVVMALFAWVAWMDRDVKRKESK